MDGVVGLILSAGASSRMKSPKALLRVGEDGRQTLLEDQVRRIEGTGIRDVYAVIGAHAGEIRDAHKGLGVVWVENRDWQRGAFSSVLCGLHAIAKGRKIPQDGVLLLPVDVPGVPTDVMRKIIGYGMEKGKNVIPKYKNSGGHPVFLTARFIMKVLSENNPDSRLDAYLKNDRETTLLTVDSPEILNNANTPASFMRPDT